MIVEVAGWIDLPPPPKTRRWHVGALQWLLIAGALVVALVAYSAGFASGASWAGVHLTRRRLEDD